VHSSSASDPFSLLACELTLTVFSPLLSKEARRLGERTGQKVRLWLAKKKPEQNNGATLVAFPSLRAFFALACGNWQQSCCQRASAQPRAVLARCATGLDWTGPRPSVATCCPPQTPPCCLRLVNCERRKAGQAHQPTGHCTKVYRCLRYRCYYHVGPVLPLALVLAPHLLI
jgi:hypothetical protein